MSCQIGPEIRTGLADNRLQEQPAVAKRLGITAPRFFKQGSRGAEGARKYVSKGTPDLCGRCRNLEIAATFREWRMSRLFG